MARIRSICAGLSVAMVAACASHQRGPACDASPDQSLGFPVFNACAVTREARPSGTPPALQYTPSAPIPCAVAIIDVVVDAQGRPRPETAKVVRTNDNSLANALLLSLPQRSYTPALKDGMPVASRTRVDFRVAMASGRSAGEARMAARSNRMACG